MKKLLSIIVIVCAFMGICTLTAFAQTTEPSTDVIADTTESEFSDTAVETEEITETTTKKAATVNTTEFVLDLDVNERYTDIFDETESFITGKTEEEKESSKTVYIAILCAALVVSVVILAVSLKRVPKEEDIDISGQNKTRKDKKE
ncbi:MAG: hypothetical protein ACI4VW_06190 [Acutalibacteraceae bacterium]